MELKISFRVCVKKKKKKKENSKKYDTSCIVRMKARTKRFSVHGKRQRNKVISCLIVRAILSPFNRRKITFHSAVLFIHSVSWLEIPALIVRGMRGAARLHTTLGEPGVTQVV